MAILITGGLGYIGSHTVVQLLEKNEDLIILDNLSNTTLEVLSNIETITKKKVQFVEGDIRDETLLSKLFINHKIDAVIHFAGLKAVGESNELPLTYYDNNVAGTITLLKVMNEYNCKKIVFSSSATVYGNSLDVPFHESLPLQTTNPYGTTKRMIEEILVDLSKSDPSWRIMLLRYFNPIGAHQSGLIGENPTGIPNNLLPYIARVSTGELEQLSVFGNDYDTKDGTGVRDYIHVEDLADGHLKALHYLDKHLGIEVVNLGTGIGYSVLEVIKAFEKASGQIINYQIVSRREGDIGTCYANPRKAKDLLGWTATKSLEDMCVDAWYFTNKAGEK